MIRKLYLVVVRELRYNSVFANRCEIALWLTIVSGPFDIGIYLPESVCDYRYLGREPSRKLGRCRAVVAVVSDFEQIHFMKLRQK